MEGLVILAGLIVIGLLVAVVVYAALLLHEMKKMSCTTSALLHNADLAQSRLQAGLAAIAHALDPNAAAATVTATVEPVEPTNEPVATDSLTPEPVVTTTSTTTKPVSEPVVPSAPVAPLRTRKPKLAARTKPLSASRSLA